ncbi:hypothetical protein Lesp02_56960 [Lentzea sp. NBRC 105346]|uniref:S1 family peptidase n=1 Tax=Lentzea sp. NBRC 105346 TaxID=3032205 RepID=UPI00249FACE5|nr:S1 family peptidase [Lentzea sp. NBRC 105346]GLZ33508.1 hypothetical protein Lesp02_56960 [Lentzea sp. NBRC 105346]
MLYARALAAACLAAAVLTTPANASDDMMSAVQRDLGLSAQEAQARIQADKQASDTAVKVRKAHSAIYAGSWIDKGRLHIALTRQVDVPGAKTTVVKRTEQELDAIKSTLDAKPKNENVVGWYVDVARNRVVVKARDLGEGKRFAAGTDAEVVVTNEQPRALIDVIGGNAYYINGNTRCSVGFSVSGGFVTAGHCGTSGATTTQPSGTFRGSSFPGNDYAWVQVASGNTPQPLVNNYAGGNVTIAGSQDAPVGSTVCRSGSTTGWHCGTIQARNASVTYPQGTVNGLIQTTVCAEPGDSGGSLVAGDQAQGVTSGGSGNCSSGGTTYFQPVNEILQAYGLTLLTSGGGGGGCTGQNTYNGSVSQGGSSYQPNGSYYYSGSSGTHSGCLTGPSGTDFDLYLQKWNGSAWTTVASAESSSSSETISYSGTAGYYTWQVYAYSGSGSYTLKTSNP